MENFLWMIFQRLPSNLSVKFDELWNIYINNLDILSYVKDKSLGEYLKDKAIGKIQFILLKTWNLGNIVTNI